MMRKQLFVLSLMLMAVMAVSAQKRFKTYAVGFYNQENLFDTIHDEGKKDADFLPDGKYHWDSNKYNNKLKNMAQALSDMGTTGLPDQGCAVIGLAEVENARVLNDLIRQPQLKARGYKYVHIEGPDARGIDCAMLYNPSLFTVESAHLYPYVQHLAEEPNFITRGFLAVNGKLADEPVTIIVCHLPSRFSKAAYRIQGAEEVKALKDSLQKADKKRKFFIMGDMNDDPIDSSMHVALQAKEEISMVKKHDMYNPWYNILAKDNTGTLLYRGKWNLFDQIILSPNLLPKGKKSDYKKLTYQRNEIQRMPYLFQTEGKYAGTLKRTTAGGKWLNGYSDHLPVVVYLQKKE